MLDVLGDRLLALCRGASGSFLVAAPFIKDYVLAKVLDALPPSVTEVTCVTRWLPEEVAAGVSDLEVFDLVAARPGAHLLLLPTLHAKLFRSETKCLVGSANLTGRALGWKSPPNLELLAEVPYSHPDVTAFVSVLLASAFPADELTRDAVRKEADRLVAEGRVLAFPDVAENASAPPPRTWLPRCTVADQLWTIYSNASDIWKVLESNIESARIDLAVLGIPQGLPSQMFRNRVIAVLKQMPLVAEIDRRTLAGISDADAIELIRTSIPEGEMPFSAEDAWSILKEWLQYFFPDIYRRAVQGEVFVRGRELRS